MTLTLRTVPCLSDNYAFLLHDPDSGETAVIDVPDAAPIQAALAKEGWTLSEIWITHHHPDHIAGVADLVAATGARVTGAQADAHRLPALDRAVAPGTGFTFARTPVDVLDVSGHTVGHIAYVTPHHAFTGDSLMALGCGRLFEGTPDQMHESLNRLAALPPETILCSGHEYTLANGTFALTIEPQNTDLISRVEATQAARARNIATVPSTLALELATNPYLRCDSPAILSHLGMEGASPAAVFAEIRARKDRF